MLDNIFKDFDSVWKGYKREIVGKGWIDIHEKAISRDEFTKNYDVAKKLAADGEHIKILPIHEGTGIKNWKKPDYLINASLWELESGISKWKCLNFQIRACHKVCVNDQDMAEIPEEKTWSWHERGRRKKRASWIRFLTPLISEGWPRARQQGKTA